jgi:ABC-type iron transport system FetAB permease component
LIYKLKWFEYAALLLLIGIGYALIIKQEFAIPEYYRTGSLLLILLVIYLAFFYIVRPRHPKALSNFLSCFCSSLAATLIIVQHVVLNAGFSYTVNVVIISTFIMPFAAGFLYSRLRRMKWYKN